MKSFASNNNTIHTSYLLWYNVLIINLFYLVSKERISWKELTFEEVGLELIADLEKLRI
jgi:hypothetical protein